ncbi:MAG: general secretion pathway protein GspK [Thermodesulfovibrionales bacterium]|nr:general secretion pathway protein GspK [Thermodesulfovibrionales bacterium]
MIRHEKGIVLVLVLWILTILMVLSLSLSYAVKTELMGTFAYKEDAENKYLARAGIERAKMELVYKKIHRNPEDEAWSDNGTIYDFELGRGNVSVRIVNETGKIDINYAQESILKKLFVNQGMTEEEADELVDCIMDWKDPDDVRRLKGAEQEYYSSLKNPYKIKNANFENVDELLFVKGMTKQLLYGGDGKRGIIDILTVYSRMPTVNINSAPVEVLKAVPGISTEMANAIVERRKEKPLQSTQDIADILAESMAEATRYINFQQSVLYTIESEASKSGKYPYGVRAVIAMQGNNQFTTYYYKEPARMRR